MGWLTLGKKHTEILSTSVLVFCTLEGTRNVICSLMKGKLTEINRIRIELGNTGLKSQVVSNENGFSKSGQMYLYI